MNPKPERENWNIKLLGKKYRRISLQLGDRQMVSEVTESNSHKWKNWWVRLH